MAPGAPGLVEGFVEGCVFLMCALDVAILQVLQNFSLLSMAVVPCHISFSEAVRRAMILQCPRRCCKRSTAMSV
jgi:hypothetical protein